MKIVLTFKDPDYMSDNGHAVLTKKVQKVISKFLEYDEYVRIEIDTEKKTARVLEN